MTATRIPIGARAPTTFIEIEEPRGFIDLSTALGHKLTCYGHAPVTCCVDVVVVAAAADLRERTWRHALLHSSRTRDESQI